MFYVLLSKVIELLCVWGHFIHLSIPQSLRVGYCSLNPLKPVLKYYLGDWFLERPRIEDAGAFLQTISSNQVIMWRSFFAPFVYATNTTWISATCFSHLWRNNSEQKQTHLWLRAAYREAGHGLGARLSSHAQVQIPCLSLIFWLALEKLLHLEHSFLLWG